MTWTNWLRRPPRLRPIRRNYRLALIDLEDRVTPVAPATPVITEPFAENQITGTFDINMQTNPAQYFDADGHAWAATDWQIRDVASGQTVWQLPFTTSPPLTLYRVDFSDGVFVGPLAGRTELNYNTNYQLLVRYRDSNGEVSASAVRNFRTAGATQPVPGVGQWLVRPGYVLEPVQTGLRLPVNMAFVPNPGPNPSDPLYYVTELYGSIRVVRRDGTMSTFATNLLDYNPQGPISGTGEQGLTGLAVERDAVNPAVYHLYVGMLWDNGAPPGAPNHYPKVERITSAAGGLTAATRTVLLNMQPETQGQSHIISNITIGPDNKLYVHMGDGFNAATALNLDQYRGKVLRMNKDGSPVATGDPAGANPFYNAANGINARDYVWTYGHRNPFGGAWRPGTTEHWVVENGNSLDRMVKLVGGQSYGWAGNDATHVQFSDFVWNPSTAPVNIDFVDASRFGGSGFPADAYGHAFVSLSGTTYASGPLQSSKGIVEFSDLNTYLPPSGSNSPKLAVQPSFLVKYNGTGRGTVAALAAGPDGIYFSDLYEDTGANGATASGANIYRVRYVGTAGGAVPTVATPAAATPNPVNTGVTTNLSVLGADDGGEPALTYTWGVQGTPPAPVSFTPNGANAAKNAVATFAANGTYTLFVVIRDTGGQTAISTVTVNVTSVPTGNGNGLTGVYYNNADFTGTTVTRNDSTVDFNWGAGAPAAGIDAETFSVRWTGYVQARYSETYTFTTTTDDGVRLYVNDQLIINQFVVQGPTSWTGTVALTAGQFYAIRMEYFDNTGGASARLEWQSTTQPREVVPRAQLYTPTAVPATPTGLTAVPFSGTRVNLSWANAAAAPNFADGFLVEQSPNGTTGWAQIASVAGTTHAVNGLTPGTPYYFRVRSFNSVGNSAYTLVVGATTSATGNSVNYPNDFSTVPAGGALTFVGGAAVVTNRLRLTSGVGDQARAVYATNQQTVTAFTTSFTYTKTGAADGATFVIHRDPRGLAAVGFAGNQLAYGGAGAITPSFAFAMNIYQPNNYGTAFVTNGATPGGYTQANGIDFGADNSPVTVTITYLGGSTLNVTMTQGGNSQTKTFTFASTLPALLGGTSAFIGFTASTGGATSTQEITNWTFATLTVPSAPANLQAQATGYTASSTGPVPIGAGLTWTAAAGAATYEIDRKLTAGGTYAEVGTSVAPAFNDAGLAANSTYFYRVRGTNLVGDGTNSAEVILTTPAVPAAPTGGQATGVTTAAVNLSWADNATNEDGYQVFRSVNGGAFSLRTALPANSTTYADGGLTPGTRYDYRVVAFNLAGPSTFALVPTATLTAAPTGLAASSFSGTIRLTWTATPGATSYSVYRSTTPGGQGTTPLVGGLASPTYDDSALAFGSTYYYVVTASTLGGESAKSAEASNLAFGGTATALNSSLNPSGFGAGVTFTATVASAGGTPTTGTVQFFDGGNPLGAPVAVNASGVATLVSSVLGVGTHAITAQFGGATGFTPSTSPAVSQQVVAPARVESAVPNGLAGQRSRVTSVSVTFDTVVTFANPANVAAAFRLSRIGGGSVGGFTATAATVGGKTVVTLTGFTGAETVGGSLADGRYAVTVVANQVTLFGALLDGDGNGVGGDDYVLNGTRENGLFRYYGDFDGDGDVDGSDLVAYVPTLFNAGNYAPQFDSDGDGDVDGSDLVEFVGNLFVPIP